MLFHKRDLIAMSTTGMTFPLPALAIRALEHRKRFVLIVMERAMRAFLSSLAVSERSHQVWQRQSPSLSLVNFLSQIVHFAPPAVLILPAVFNATCGRKFPENWSPADTK